MKKRGRRNLRSSFNSSTESPQSELKPMNQPKVVIPRLSEEVMDIYLNKSNPKGNPKRRLGKETECSPVVTPTKRFTNLSNEEEFNTSAGSWRVKRKHLFDTSDDEEEQSPLVLRLTRGKKKQQFVDYRESDDEKQARCSTSKISKSKHRDSHNDNIQKQETNVNMSTPKPALLLRRSARLSTTTRKDYFPDEIHDTPKSHLKKFQEKTQTQSTPRTPKKETPTQRARSIREGVITPSIQSRELNIREDNTPLAQARNRLHVSHVPKSLPCRDRDFDEIETFVSGKIRDGCGGLIYVSGVPGTGKTATVAQVMSFLRQQVEKTRLPEFDYVNVNGMKVTEPKQIYVEMYKQLGGKSVGWEKARDLLDEQFTKKKKKKTKPTVIVIDELDILCTKRQDVIYNLFDWPFKAKIPLIMITIANAMDLPERVLKSKVTSRLGLTRLIFNPYTYKQLQEIVTNRLEELNTFNCDAIQLVARKIASVSGDARRALDICRRAVEIAQGEGPETSVAIKHVNDALTAMMTQPKILAIKHCSQLEQLILRSIVAEVERTGAEETKISSIYKMFQTVAALYDFPITSVTMVSNAINQLGASRLLIVESTCSNILQKVMLNISSDDVHYALDTNLLRDMNL